VPGRRAAPRDGRHALRAAARARARRRSRGRSQPSGARPRRRRVARGTPVRSAALLCVLLLLAGCFSSPPTVAPAGEASPAGAASQAAPSALDAPTFRAPVLLGVARPDGAEPNIVATRDGRVFVTTYPSLWRSLDGGASFEA